MGLVIYLLIVVSSKKFLNADSLNSLRNMYIVLIGYAGIETSKPILMTRDEVTKSARFSISITRGIIVRIGQLHCTLI